MRSASTPGARARCSPAAGCTARASTSTSSRSSASSASTKTMTPSCLPTYPEPVAELPLTSMQRDGRSTLSAGHRAGNLVAVAVPFAGFLVAIALLWNRFVSWSDIAVLFVMYTLALAGVTIGYHRLLTHRSFETYPAIRWLFTALGSLGVEGPAITWVADHRKHHAFADEDGDPHSPHGHGDGFGG